MFPSGQVMAKCPLVCSSENYWPEPAPFSSMLALVQVPQAGDNIKYVKSITLHSSYLGNTVE